MRRLALLLLIAAVVPAAALSARNPHAEKRHHTRADMALARRVLLRQSDVGPAWRRVAVPPDNSPPGCPGFDPDFSRFTITGESQVLYLRGSQDQIVSTSQVYPTRAQAIGDFELGAQPALAGCLRLMLVRAFRSAPGVKIVRASAHVARAPNVGERVQAYRLTATISQSGLQVRVYMDVLGFLRGRTQAGLVFTGIGAPVPSQLTYARAVDARLR